MTKERFYVHKTTHNCFGVLFVVLAVFGSAWASLGAETVIIENRSPSGVGRWRLYGNGTLLYSGSLGGGATHANNHDTNFDGKNITTFYQLTSGGSTNTPAMPASFSVPSGISDIYYFVTIFSEDVTNCATITQGITLRNNTGGDVFGHWEVNGIEVYTSTIGPGEEHAHLEEIEICPGGGGDVYRGYTSRANVTISVGGNGDVDWEDNPDYSPPVTIGGGDGNAPPGLTNAISVNPGAFNPTNVNWKDYTNIINYTGTSATAAKDDTLKAGFGRLSDQLGEIKAAIDLNTAATIQGGGGGTNGFSLSITNVGGMGSNDWRYFMADSYSLVTNSYQAVYGYTNSGAASVANWNDLGGEGLGSVALGTAGEFSFSIGVSDDLSFDVDSAELPDGGVVVFARTLIKWATVLFTWFAMFKWGEGAMRQMFEVRQTHGSQQMLFGVNAPTLSGIAYASVISAAIASIPLALVAFLTDQAGELASAASAMSGVYSTVGYAAANYIIPIWTLVTAFATYCTYRFVVGTPLLFIVAGIIRFLVV